MSLTSYWGKADKNLSIEASEFETSAWGIWEKIESSFSTEQTSTGLGKLRGVEDVRYWKKKIKEVSERISLFRDQHFKGKQKGGVERHDRLTLELNDGGSPISFQMILGEGLDLGWEDFLLGKDSGDEINLEVTLPTLSFGHSLSSWSDTEKKLNVKILKVESSQVSILELPGKDFNWERAQEVFPEKILELTQSIQWDLAPKLLMELEEWVGEKGLKLKNDPLWEVVLKGLKEQSQHADRIGGWIEGVFFSHVMRDEQEYRCRVMIFLIDRALKCQDNIRPAEQFKEVFSVLLKAYGKTMNALLQQYKRAFTYTQRKFSSESGKSISSTWCKTRLSILEVQERFLHWLSEHPSFSMVLNEHRSSWEGTLEKGKWVRESLSLFLKTLDGLKGMTSHNTSLGFNMWLLNKTTRPMSQDIDYLLGLRDEPIELPAAISYSDDSSAFESSQSVKILDVDFLKGVEKKLARVRPKSFPQLGDLLKQPKDFDERVKAFLDTLARIGTIQSLVERIDSDQPSAENLAMKIKDFKWSFEKPLGGVGQPIRQDLDLICPLHALMDGDEVGIQKMSSAWVSLSAQCRQLIAQLLIELPRMGGMLQDMLFYGKKCNEYFVFQLPLLWAVLSKELDSYRTQARTGLRSLSGLRRKTGTQAQELNDLLGKSFAVIVLDGLLKDMEDEMKEGFWQTYLVVAKWLGDGGVKNPNGQRVLRMFLRTGILFSHPSMIKYESYLEVLVNCPSSDDEVNNPIDRSMIVYVDELFTMVGRDEVPRNVSAEKKREFEKNPSLQRENQTERGLWSMSSLIRYLSIDVYWEDMILLNSEKEEQKDDSRKERIEKLGVKKRALLELKEKYESKKRDVLQETRETSYLDEEVLFVREQSKLLSGEESYLPFSLLNSLSRPEFQLSWEKYHKLVKVLRHKNIKQVFDYEAKGSNARFTMNVRPLMILVPALGTSGSCVQSRSVSDLGQLTLPMFRDPNHTTHELILKAIGMFWIDSCNERNHLSNTESLLTEYRNYRRKSLKKPKEIYEDEGFLKKHSDRENFINHFMLYLSSKGGERLRLKSRTLFKLLAKHIRLVPGMKGFK